MQEPVFNLPKKPDDIAGWAFFGQLLVIYHHGAKEIPDARMSEFFRDAEERGFTHLFSFGVGGAQINSVQRKKISELISGKPVVVIVDNPITRGMVTAMSWLGINIKSFAWKDMRKAIDFLSPPGLAPDDLIRELERLARLSIEVVGGDAPREDWNVL